MPRKQTRTKSETTGGDSGHTPGGYQFVAGYFSHKYQQVVLIASSEDLPFAENYACYYAVEHTLPRLRNIARKADDTVSLRRYDAWQDKLKATAHLGRRDPDSYTKLLAQLNKLMPEGWPVYFAQRVSWRKTPDPAFYEQNQIKPGR